MTRLHSLRPVPVLPPTFHSALRTNRLTMEPPQSRFASSLAAFGKAHPKGTVSLSRTLRSREAQRADRQSEEAGRRESSVSKRPTELSRGLLAAFGKAHPKGTVSLSRTLRSREAQRADRQSEEAGRRESSVSKRPTELSRGLLAAFGKAHPKGTVSLSRTLRSREAQRADRQSEEAGRRESSVSKRPTELSRGLLAAFGKAHPKGTVSLSRTLRSREAQRADRQSEEAGRRESSVSKRPSELSRGLLERRSGIRTEHPEAQRIPGAVLRKELDESSDRRRTKAGIRWVREATGELLIAALVGVPGAPP